MILLYAATAAVWLVLIGAAVGGTVLAVRERRRYLR